MNSCLEARLRIEAVMIPCPPERWPCHVSEYAVLQKPGMDVADGYVTFVRHSQDILRDKVNEEVYIERLFDVSKMPSPPHHKGGAFQNVAKQQGRQG